MKRILVVFNPGRKEIIKLASEIVKKLSRDYKVFCYDSKKVFQSKIQPDLIVSLGGDGTILRVTQIAVRLSVPVIGVNVGGLGYLAEYTTKEVYGSINKYFSNKIFPQERAILEIKFHQKIYYAINDCIIKSYSSRVVSLDLYINGDYITNIIGDGIIVATPTGSTAYSLACGGSIVEPEAKVMLVTPVCPHALSYRPIILTEDKVVKIFIPEYKSNTQLLLSFDSQENFPLGVSDFVEIYISKKKFLFIPNLKKNFYTILKEKLNWAKR